MPNPSYWAISFSLCLKAISSSELAVFIVCCLGEMENQMLHVLILKVTTGNYWEITRKLGETLKY